MLLVIAMAFVIAFVTVLSLLLIRHQLTRQVTQDLTRDLDRSVANFRNLQAERLAVLERENALVAKLPTLKALMTSGDDLTIQDGAAEFWRVSGSDLFLLVDQSGRLAASSPQHEPADERLRKGIQLLLRSTDKHYLADGNALYSCSIQPLYFGSDETGTLLGYVISGVTLERSLRQISVSTGVEAAFMSNGRIVVSSFTAPVQQDLTRQSAEFSSPGGGAATITIGGTRFLATVEDLSSASTLPLQLVVFKSLKPAEESIGRIDRMVLFVGLLALISGTALMVLVSHFVTRPLEELSESVKAFGVGDVQRRVPRHGTQEVRELSTAFSAMRSEIQKANQTVLESERLATIGRMASSVSHDLRHYLAAIYANAEFLASDRFSARERAEIFGDIRMAVNGTTDMLESLLVFSRSGSGLRRQPELMASLLERAVILIRTHPDADGVRIETHSVSPDGTTAIVDGKQIERAISNLLLNACQAAREVGPSAFVAITLEAKPDFIVVSVIDNGPGVPDSIRTNLFEPFISVGKQKGTGLGLTLAHCIALEHGGEVILLSSRPGETVFQMKVARSISLNSGAGAEELKRREQVIPDDKI
jgi:Signal transduction histidine kinase regulating C4-dicarboxylate transport system